MKQAPCQGSSGADPADFSQNPRGPGRAPSGFRGHADPRAWNFTLAARVIPDARRLGQARPVCKLNPMANKKRPEEPASRWRGQAVERQPGDEAERAADRVEGREPVRADAEARRLGRGSEQDLEDQAPAVAAAGSAADDDTEQAAEEHRERQAAEGYPPRGKL